VNAAAAGISVAATGWPRALAALLLVLGVALLLAWALRRAGIAKPLAPTRLDLVASRPLDGRNRLVVVRWDGREHLLAVGPAGDHGDREPRRGGSDDAAASAS
jgi:flagellar protein FliO/FliZ